MVAVVVVATALAVAAPLIATSNADFFGRYHLLNRRYVNLENSAHVGIGCRDCHETDPVRNGLQLTAEFYTGMFTKREVPKYFAFRPPTNDACLKCHRTDWSSDASRTKLIPHPAHARVVAEKRPCVKCHKWTAHFETYMPKHKKMPFSGVCVSYGCHVGTKAPSQCFNCHHVLHNSVAQWKQAHPAVVKAVGENGCLESCHRVEQCQTCHTTGQMPQVAKPVIRTGVDAIERLHVKADWRLKTHGTQALLDRKRCLLCHQSEAECQECHRFRPAFHGDPTTWIGTHNKIAKKVDSPRCLECHQRAWCDKCHKQFKEME